MIRQRVRNLLSCLVLCLCCAWPPAIPALAANQEVTLDTDANSGGGGNAGDLRYAIANVGDGDTITFNISGSDTVTINAELQISSKNITIEGTNTATGNDITVQVAVPGGGGSAFRVFNINASGKTITIRDMTINGGDISGNEDVASGYGGGIYHAAGTLNMENTIVSGSKAARGGGIWCTGSVTLVRCSATGNRADFYDSSYEIQKGAGGGIYNYNGALTMTDCTIHANFAVNTAGGICNDGAHYGSCSANLTGCTLDHNTVDNGWGGSGGAIFNDGYFGSCSATLTNCTLTANSAVRGSGQGGAIYVNGYTGTSNTTLIGCTVSGNTAGNKGGGIYNNYASVSLKNTILGANTATTVPGAADYGENGGSETDNGYNLVQSSSSVWSGTGTITGQDPQLGDLGNYGGNTQTVILCKAADGTTNGCNNATSPAIDAILSDSGQCGSVAPYNVDQRGVDRPYNVNCDIGAYERTGSTLVELTSFEATADADSVLLSWQTASEIDNAGFHVWRSETKDWGYEKITDILIPAEGSPTQGASYTFEDQTATPGKTYYYKLEDFDTAGNSTYHQVVSAWPGVVNIAVNGADGPAAVPAAEPVSVKVSVRPEEDATASQEWWLFCDTPFGWFSYVNPNRWLPGIHPAWVNPQTPIENLEVLNAPLPKGDYRFHFALDSRVDGRAPAPLFTPQAQPLDHLFLNTIETTPTGFQQLNRWQTAVPKWLDSVEVRVE